MSLTPASMFAAIRSYFGLEAEASIKDGRRRLGRLRFARGHAGFRFEGRTYEARRDGDLWMMNSDRGPVIAHRGGRIKAPELDAAGGGLELRSRWFRPGSYEALMRGTTVGSVEVHGALHEEGIVVDLALALPPPLRAFVGWFAFELSCLPRTFPYL
jgi:hypothetical protein